MQGKKKITYIVSHIDRAIGFEHICEQLGNRYAFHFILLNRGDSYLERYCRRHSIACTRIPYAGKKDLLSAVLRIYRILRKERPDIVHTHLLDASISGLLAAKLAGIGSRIHSRHHSDFHHVYFPHAVKYDRFINRLSKRIVAVSPNVRDILLKKENVPAEKVIQLFHGFKLEEFDDVSGERVRILKERYRVGNHRPVVGVISRYTEWKGIQYIIPAFRKFLVEYPQALLILANAQGTYKPEIEKLLKDLPENSYREIAFEHDLHALYKLFDVFIHVPVSKESEAFGQVYIEAMLSGVPAIFTRSGIANEFPGDPPVCEFVDFSDPDQICSKLSALMGDSARRESIRKNAMSYARENFGLMKQLKDLTTLYESL
jgi:glycosyltransferase involved in cell wall biosynthesis